VAELADAHGSGPCTRKGVGVRVPSSAPTHFSSMIPAKKESLVQAGAGEITDKDVLF
jgi:hypothetical protein